MEMIWKCVENIMMQAQIVNVIGSAYIDIDRVTTANNMLYHLYWSGKFGIKLYFLSIVDTDKKTCPAMIISSSKRRIVKYMRELIREDNKVV